MTNKTINPYTISGLIIVLIFIALSHIGPSLFECLERTVYDTEVKLDRKNKSGAKEIVLIEIDNKSLNRIGRWPWPRYLIADMIMKLKARGVKLVGIDIPFFEKELNQGLKEIKAFREKFTAYSAEKKDKDLTSWVLENLNQMEAGMDNDRRLVESVRQSGNVVLPVSRISEGEYISKNKAGKETDSFLSKNFLTARNISDSLKSRTTLTDLSFPFPELAGAASGLGYENFVPSGDTIGRSYPMFIRYKGSLLPSFPLRLALSYFNQRPSQVIVREDQVILKGRTIPLMGGNMLIQLQNGQNDFLHFSFVDILWAKQVPKIVEKKIAIIGFNGKESGQVPGQFPADMSKDELTANILNNIIHKNFISRPLYMTYIEIFAIILLGGFAAFFFPRLGQLSRLGWMTGLTGLTFIAGFILLSMMGIWLKTTYIAGCIIIMYLFISAGKMLTTEKNTKESIETNRLLGLSFQSQGLLDLAFDKFRKLPLDDEAKELMYNLGLEYEQKRLINKALSVYEYINKREKYRDLNTRIPKLKQSDRSSTIGSHGGVSDASPLADVDAEKRTRVGRFEIIGELGKGSMGLVYKALDPKINRLLAIKTIRFSDEFEEDVIHEIKERFFREAEIAGRLSHPSIVTIYDVGDDRDLTYMAMEFLEGKDLDKLISKEKLLPLMKVLDIVARIADALDFAHKAEVIHRDIKPANIMLLDNGGIKVTDFGIAKAISTTRTKTGIILGTPNYMSPEQIMGQKINYQSDIFSLGVLFYQLLTGDVPFHGNNLSNLLYQITQVKHPPVRNYNPKIPRACEQIIDRAMAKDPKDRFAKAGDMARIVRLLISKIDQIKRKKQT